MSLRPHPRGARVTCTAFLLGAAALGCLRPPSIAELKAKRAGRTETAAIKPNHFYDASWGDSSDKEGKGGTKLTANDARRTLPLREDNFSRKLVGDSSTKTHANWLVFHSQRHGEGKAVSFEWQWTTTKEEKFSTNMWAGAGIAFDSSWNNLDITGAKYLVLYAKASRADLTDLDLSMRLHSVNSAKGQEATSRVQLQQFTDAKKIGTSWTKIIIPMKAFFDLDLVDVTKLHTIDFEVGGKYPENEKLWVHLDNIYFTDVDLLTPVENLGYVIAKDGVILLWDKDPNEKPLKFTVTVDGKVAGTVDGAKREFKLPLASLGGGVAHQVGVIPAAAGGTASERQISVSLRATSTEPASATVMLDSQPGHEISPFLFGSNGMSPLAIKETSATINRWGGPGSTTYNWKGDLDNKGSDAFFASDGTKPENTPETDKRYYKFVKETLDAGAAVNFTIPIAPWIAMPAPAGKRLCSFPTQLYPQQEKTDGQGCGNGVLPDGKEWIWGNDPKLVYVPNSVEVQKGLVENISKITGTAAGTEVKFYSLDHEPGSWRLVHRDLAPKGLTTDELIALNVKYATMVKSVDPNAKVIGFAAAGPLELAASNADFTPPGDDGYKRYDKFKHGEPRWADRKNHNDQPQLVSFLQGIRKAEQEAGKRLIDVIDVHWYPECYGKDEKGETKRLSEDLPYDSALAPKQFDALHEWYDDGYSPEESWMAGVGIRKLLWDPFHPVLPALKKMVEDNDPGAKLAINEYAVGSADHYHGALLRVAALGIFMQQDLYMAGNVLQGDARQPAYWAQRLYGNYDGKGGKVRGRFVKTQSSNPELMSFAVDDSGKEDVVLVNKSETISLTVNLKLPHDPKSVTVYQIGENAGRRIYASPLEGFSAKEISIFVPAYSALLVVAQ